eukprot:1524410-Amphidinium_carterae.2
MNLALVTLSRSTKVSCTATTSCFMFRTGSTKLHPPGLTLQMRGPGLAASPTRQVGGNQPSCLGLKSKEAAKVLGSQR